MTKRNLIIVIILLSVIDLVAAGWYMSRRIETGDNGEGLFGRRDSSEVITEADTVVSTSVPDVFDKMEHSSSYYVANSPSVSGDKSTSYTSIKHVKVRWPLAEQGVGRQGIRQQPFPDEGRALHVPENAVFQQADG